MLDWLNACLDLCVLFLNADLLQYWFYPMISLCFLASFPAIIRAFTTWR